MITYIIAPNLFKWYLNSKLCGMATWGGLKKPSAGSNNHPQTHKQFTQCHVKLYPKAHRFKKNEIAMKFELEIIEQAQTDWTRPTVFAPKKDSRLQFCAGYRYLNAVTVHDSYSIFCMDECIHYLGHTKILWTLHAISCYQQVEIAKRDRAKTALASHHGLIQFSCAIWIEKRPRRISTCSGCHFVCSPLAFVIILSD